MRVALLLTLAAADLPVHCLRTEVAGDWVFRLGRPSPQRTSCGHQRPDVENDQPRELGEPVLKEKSLKLLNPNTVKGESGDGNWTMIYDEGFEVRVDGMVFFSFSYYDLVGTKNTTNCARTVRGWYHDGESYGCYQGEQTRADRAVRREPETPEKPVKVALLEVDEMDYHRPLSLQFLQNTAETINARGRTWTAKAYSRFAGKSMEDLNRLAGLPRELPRTSALQACSPEVHHAKPGSLMPHLMLRGLSSTPCNHPSAEDKNTASELAKAEASLPTDFTWRDVNGTDYVGPVIDQADCGSCYIVSTTKMLSSRNRVAQKDASLPDFSISFPLHCSEYNQGCKGGYAFLGSKWASDVGLVPDTCFPYNTEGKCELKCDLDKVERHRATEYGYIGDYYGGSSAAKMMQELYENGPVVVSFEPTDEFMYYGEGIFVSGNTRLHQEWQKVDHAVLLIGWGEEGGQKYWLVQNSWGETWGEAGYFRIARGENDSGIESISVKAKVVKDDRKANHVSDFFASI
jgi:cathepsin C